MRGIRRDTIRLLDQVRFAKSGRPVPDTVRKLAQEHFAAFTAGELIRAAALVEHGRVECRRANASREPDVRALVEALGKARSTGDLG